MIEVSENENKQRINWIDVAKGYGTLLVIWAHLQDEGLKNWIYSFHMPLFFFLSGYVFKPKYNFIDFVKRKCKSIVVPYFCLGIPIVLAQSFADTLEGKNLIEQLGVNLKALVLQQRIWTLWYMACLFCLSILCYVLVKCLKSEWMLSIVVLVMTLLGLTYYRQDGEAWIWNLDVCFTAIPFFYSGYLYREKKYSFQDVFNTKCKKTLLFLLVAVINVVSWKLSLDESGTGLEMFYCKYGNPVYTYIAAFTGIVGIVLISKAFVIKPIRYLGENSMIYYAWHQAIMLPIIKRCASFIGLDVLLDGGVIGIVVYKCIIILVAVALLTICNVIIRNSRLKFVLGV